MKYSRSTVGVIRQPASASLSLIGFLLSVGRVGGSETAAVVGRSKQYFPGFSASACVSAGVVTLRHCVPGKLATVR